MQKKIISYSVLSHIGFMCLHMHTYMHACTTSCIHTPRKYIELLRKVTNYGEKGMRERWKITRFIQNGIFSDLCSFCSVNICSNMLKSMLRLVNRLFIVFPWKKILTVDLWCKYTWNQLTEPPDCTVSCKHFKVVTSPSITETKKWRCQLIRETIYLVIF